MFLIRLNLLNLFIILSVPFVMSNVALADQDVLIAQNLGSTLPGGTPEGVSKQLEEYLKRKKLQQQRQRKLAQPKKAVKLAAPAMKLHPAAQTQDKARQELNRMYKDSVRNVTKELNSQLLNLKKKSQVFVWDDEETRAEKLNEIRRLEKSIMEMKEIEKGAFNEAPKQVDSWEPRHNWQNNPVNIPKGQYLRKLEDLSVGIGSFD